jgi:hypothetical protein
MKAGAPLRALALVASLVERYGERCGGPLILAGLGGWSWGGAARQRAAGPD